ncbi:MAG: ferrous iron transport protein A [Victivallales bacterium]|nr:ferrous iron transport protein A [Victivallales bacterium]
MQKPLSLMEPGEKGKIISISHKMRSYKKFADLGIVKGTSLSMERIAPLGDPIEVKIKGYSLSFRKEEALNITVEIDNDKNT